MPHVVEINRIEELDQYCLLWSSLLQQTRGASFFHSLPWLQAYWRHFGQNSRLRVLMVSSRGEPAGILPLMVFGERTRIGRVRVLTYPLHDWATFYGPIGPHPTVTLLAAMRHIAATPRDWDILDLRFINNTEHDHGRTQLAMQLAGFQGREGVWKTTAIVDFQGTWAEYLDSRTSRFRNNLRRAEARINGHGEVTYQRYRPLGAMHGDADPRWDLYEQCVELARRSWQGSSASGTTLCHPGVRDFLRVTHELAVRAGALDLNLLRLDGRPIAFTYNYQHDGSLYGLRLGYDPDYADLGVGNVLLARSLENSFYRGDHQIDLGTDSLHVKRNWLTRTLPSYRYTHYALGSARSQLLRLKHWLRRPKRSGVSFGQASHYMVNPIAEKDSRPLNVTSLSPQSARPLVLRPVLATLPCRRANSPTRKTDGLN